MKSVCTFVFLMSCVAFVAGFACGKYECEGASNKCCYDATHGPVCYDPKSYRCMNSSAGSVLCLFSSGQFHGACGAICYDKTRYLCDKRGLLVPAGDQNGLPTASPTTQTPTAPPHTSPTGVYVGTYNAAGSGHVSVFPPSNRLPALTFVAHLIEEGSPGAHVQVASAPFVVFNAPSTRRSGAAAALLKFDYIYSGSPFSLDVVLTSCANESYSSCSGLADSCFPPNENRVFDWKLCPCNNCQVLKSHNVVLSPSGTASIELGIVTFPVTISFVPNIRRESKEATVSGQALISDLALTF